MAEFPRKADGRRVFTVDFKRETVARIVSGEKTLAELSRELGWIDDYNRIAPHSSLGMRSPKEFCALNPQTSCV